ncbi:prepilin-type N-terminal cleavage/methylation domain-containing protein [Candidatus Microgenomates bacterium]|nr:prepilin-type N-terminal cleavage/methylation domain-containing protein [Candidatus Microgenomates bacterium]
MYRANIRTAGFTLIEVIIVLAISGALAVGLLNRYSITQRRARFTAAVEQTVARLDGFRNETSSSYVPGGDGGAAGGLGSDSQVFLGRLVTFNVNSSTLTVATLVADNTDVRANVQTSGSANTFTIPWGVTIASATSFNQILFSREPASGLNNTYVMQGTDLNNNSNYNDDGTVTIRLRSDNSAYLADIVIDAQTGSVNRSYLN